MKWSRRAFRSSEGTSRGSDTKQGQQGGVLIEVCQGLGWGRRGRGLTWNTAQTGATRECKNCPRIRAGWWYKRGMRRPRQALGLGVWGVEMDRQGRLPTSGQTMCAASGRHSRQKGIGSRGHGRRAYEIGEWCGAAVVVQS